jgi:hypothetical protein
MAESEAIVTTVPIRRRGVCLALLTAAVLAAGCGSEQPSAPAAPSPATVPVLFVLESTPIPALSDPMLAAEAQYWVRNMLGRSSLRFGFSEQSFYMEERSPGVAAHRQRRTAGGRHDVPAQRYAGAAVPRLFRRTGHRLNG